MEYTVNKLAKLAGISTRTLRYYDEIGLLSPVRMSSNGYRIYGKIEVDRLQQILFYRELGVPLDEIKKIISTKDFDGVTALQSHLTALLAKRNGVTQMYVDDPRFTAYYDKIAVGCAAFLRDAVLIYCKS